MASIRFECIWGKEAVFERTQAMALWKKYRVFPHDDVGEERAKEIAFVALNESGEVVGVSTAKARQVKLFNNNYLYEFRCFVSPEFRMPALDTQLVVKTKEFFEAYPGASEFPCIGLFMVIENEMIKNQWTKAVWAGADMVFAGYTSQGHHVRVSYFKGARI